VRLIRAVLSVMMSDAIEEGYRATNPAAAPRRRGRRKVVGTLS
jgi:hypothetical protein